MSSISFDVQAILFDMDGTIVDSSIPVHKAWRSWAHEHGVGFDQVLAVMHGRRAIETMQMLAPDLPQPETVDKFLASEALDFEGIVEIPGARAFLAGLPPNRWGVVTSATQGMARSRMRAAGLPAPQVLVSADIVERGKPDPECFLRAAELLGFAAQDCLAFEDAPAGVAAAKAAGMNVVGVETNYTGGVLGTLISIAGFEGAESSSQPGPAGIRIILKHAVEWY